MRLWWSRFRGKLRDHRRMLFAVTMVVLLVSLVLYGYTMSMRGAFLRMLDEWHVINPLPPQNPADSDVASDSDSQAALTVPTPMSSAPEREIDPDSLRLAWPLVGGEVTTTFGWNYSETFADWRYHSGIDIKGKALQPVRAVRHGVILQRGECEWFGRVVLIQHEAGLKTFYGHLGDILVLPGQGVVKDQVIAHLGPVGVAERGEGEDFLHFEVLIQGEPVDPMEFLR